MNRHVNAIPGRLNLRAPQRRSLEILDHITKIVPPCKGADVAVALEMIRSEFSSVTDFERAFPSLCFALAKGVWKTHLMGAFISYLHLARGLRLPYGHKTEVDYAKTVGGKPWKYLLIPHDAVAANVTLDNLITRYGAP